jgi:hypothetical protein
MGAELGQNPRDSLPSLKFCLNAIVNLVTCIFTSGGIPETVYIHAEEVSDVTYVIDRARVKVKAIGTLTRWDVQSLRKTEPVVRVSRVAADSGDTDEPTVDLSKVGVSVSVCTVIMLE